MNKRPKQILLDMVANGSIYMNLDNQSLDELQRVMIDIINGWTIIFCDNLAELLMDIGFLVTYDTYAHYYIVEEVF